jgi:hypothetical protein
MEKREIFFSIKAVALSPAWEEEPRNVLVGFLEKI